MSVCILLPVELHDILTAACSVFLVRKWHQANQTCITSGFCDITGSSSLPTAFRKVHLLQ